MDENDVREVLFEKNLPENSSIQIKPVGNNCYRVNVFEKIASKDLCVIGSRLYTSAYICLTDSGYKDFTLRK